MVNALHTFMVVRSSNRGGNDQDVRPGSRRKRYASSLSTVMQGCRWSCLRVFIDAEIPPVEWSAMGHNFVTTIPGIAFVSLVAIWEPRGSSLTKLEQEGVIQW